MVADETGYGDFIVKRGSGVSKQDEGGVQVGFDEICWRADVEREMRSVRMHSRMETLRPRPVSQALENARFERTGQSYVTAIQRNTAGGKGRLN